MRSIWMPRRSSISARWIVESASSGPDSARPASRRESKGRRHCGMVESYALIGRGVGHIRHFCPLLNIRQGYDTTGSLSTCCLLVVDERSACQARSSGLENNIGAPRPKISRPIVSSRIAKPIKAKPIHKGVPIVRVVNIHGPTDVRIDEIPTPQIGPQDVLLKIDACGICGSDLTFSKLGFLREGGEPWPLGHEAAGTVVAAGNQVEGIAPGLRAVINPMGAYDNI